MTESERDNEIGYIDLDIKQYGKQKERLQWQIDDINQGIAFLKNKKKMLLETPLITPPKP